MKNLKPAVAPGKQGMQGPAPVSGPHPQGDPKHEHKVLGPTHPELFKGGMPSGAEDLDNLLENKGMSRDGVPGKK